MNIVIGQIVGQSAYVCDKFGNQIGWYDFEDKILFVRHDYQYMDKLSKQIIENNVNSTLYEESEKSVIQYFKDRVQKIIAYKEARREKYYEDQRREAKIKEQFKYIGRKTKYKKVKNAESKIKKRHG